MATRLCRGCATSHKVEVSFQVCHVTKASPKKIPLVPISCYSCCPSWIPNHSLIHFVQMYVWTHFSRPRSSKQHSCVDQVKDLFTPLRLLLCFRPKSEPNNNRPAVWMWCLPCASAISVGLCATLSSLCPMSEPCCKTSIISITWPYHDESWAAGLEPTPSRMPVMETTELPAFAVNFFVSWATKGERANVFTWNEAFSFGGSNPWEM